MGPLIQLAESHRSRSSRWAGLGNAFWIDWGVVAVMLMQLIPFANPKVLRLLSTLR